MQSGLRIMVWNNQLIFIYNFVCIAESEIEGLEYLPEYDILVVGQHNGSLPQSSIAAIDINTPVQGGVFCKFLPTNFPARIDVEGIAYP